MKNSKDIGSFVVLKETAISAGSRRIIAVTGTEADKAMQLANSIKSRVNGLGDNCSRADILALRELILPLPIVQQAQLREICEYPSPALLPCM